MSRSKAIVKMLGAGSLLALSFSAYSEPLRIVEFGNAQPVLNASANMAKTDTQVVIVKATTGEPVTGLTSGQVDRSCFDSKGDRTEINVSITDISTPSFKGRYDVRIAPPLNTVWWPHAVPLAPETMTCDVWIFDQARVLSGAIRLKAEMRF